MTHLSPPRIACEGWWEQEHFGRQPMHHLSLRFDGAQITGSGSDLVGLFTLKGTISQTGQVALVKQYLGQHAVDYVGTYDGEGVMWGEWRIGPLRNRWLIRLKPSVAGTQADEQIEVLSPG